MTDGFVILYRNRATSEVMLDVVDDVEEVLQSCDCRLIYVQAVSNIDTIRKEISLVNEDPELYDVNEKIADLVEQAQWISNANPLRSFSRNGPKIE